MRHILFRKDPPWLLLVIGVLGLVLGGYFVFRAAQFLSLRASLGSRGEELGTPALLFLGLGAFLALMGLYRIIKGVRAVIREHHQY